MRGRRVYGGQQALPPDQGEPGRRHARDLRLEPPRAAPAHRGRCRVGLADRTSPARARGSTRSLDVALIYFFSFFWTSLMFNPAEMSKNMKEQRLLHPRHPPGPSHRRLPAAGDDPHHAGGRHVPRRDRARPGLARPRGRRRSARSRSFLGGTSILIVVSVALDLVDKLNSRLLMRRYEGFMGGEGRRRASDERRPPRSARVRQGHPGRASEGPRRPAAPLDRRPAPGRRGGRHAARAAREAAAWTPASSSPTTS